MATLAESFLADLDELSDEEHDKVNGDAMDEDLGGEDDVSRGL